MGNNTFQWITDILLFLILLALLIPLTRRPPRV
jgi:hypothetical protein